MATPAVTGQIRPLIAFIDQDELEITDLPFVADHGKGKKARRSFWDVKPNGNYGDECLIGKAYALEALQYMMSKNFTPLLTRVVMAMPNEKDRSGIEVGFLSTIAEYASFGATIKAQRTQA